jgi:hypothetical protein
VIAALSDISAAPDTLILSTDIDIQLQRENNNLTYTELMANNTVPVPFSSVWSYAEDAARYDVAVDLQNNTTLVDMVAAENGTWLNSNTTSIPTCRANINEAAFRNSLFIGVFCAIVYTSSGYLVDCIDKKKLMSK